MSCFKQEALAEYILDLAEDSLDLAEYILDLAEDSLDLPEYFLDLSTTKVAYIADVSTIVTHSGKTDKVK